MNSAFDNRVLAFLDGSMGKAEARAFLEEVRTTPWKGEIYAQYRELENALEESSVPLDVPDALHHALASRIPILAAAAGKQPRADAGGRQRIALTAALLLLFLGISYVSVEYLRQAEPAHHSEAGEDFASEIRSGNNQSTPETAASAGRVRGSLADDGTHPGSYSHSDRGAPDRGTQSDAGVQPRDPRSGASVAAAPESGDRSVLRSGSLVSHPASQEAQLPMNTITSFSAALDYPAPSSLPGFEMPDFASERQSPFAMIYFLGGMTQVIGGGTSSGSTSGHPGVLLAGFRYTVFPWLSASLEFGQSPFLQETLHESRVALPGGNNADLVVIDRMRMRELRNWLRFRFGFDVAELAAWQIEAGGGTGMLLGKDAAIMITSGISAYRQLSSMLQARIGVNFTIARISPAVTSASDIVIGDGIVGIIRNADSAHSIVSSGMEFNFGIGLLLW